MRLSELEFMKTIRQEGRKNYNIDATGPQLDEAINYLYNERIYGTKCINHDIDDIAEIMLLGSEVQSFLIIVDEALFALQELQDYDSEEMQSYRNKLILRLNHIIHAFLETFAFYISELTFMNRFEGTLIYRTIMNINEEMQKDKNTVDIINKLKEGADKLSGNASERYISDVLRTIQVNITWNISQYMPGKDEE